MKENYPKLQTRMSAEAKKIFDMFIEDKGMTQAEFFEKYLPSLLMAIDKDLYLKIHQEVYGLPGLKDELDKIKD